MTDAQLIKQFKWVEKVRKYGGALYVTTKPGVLKLELTHYIDKYGEKSLRLKEPIIISLPSYVMRLDLHRFWLRLKEYPTNPRDVEWCMLYPTGSRNRRWVYKSGYKTYWAPCLGQRYENQYNEARSYVDRATIAAEYLQTAIPDWDGTARRSMYAHAMGLIGDEIIK